MIDVGSGVTSVKSITCFRSLWLATDRKDWIHARNSLRSQMLHVWSICLAEKWPHSRGNVNKNSLHGSYGTWSHKGSQCLHSPQMSRTAASFGDRLLPAHIQQDTSLCPMIPKRHMFVRLRLQPISQPIPCTMYLTFGMFSGISGAPSGEGVCGPTSEWKVSFVPCCEAQRFHAARGYQGATCAAEKAMF